MARKSSGTILQEELYPPSAAAPREDLDDARLVDLDVDQESPFLRGQKRVSARRSSLPKKTANRLLWACVAAASLLVMALAAAGLYDYGKHSWRFRVESSDNLEIGGMQNVTRAQIMEVMGADIGRNIFFVPLAQQKAQLEQIPWVESASVMRFVPNRIRIEIHERTPVAFARVGPHIALIDAGGTLMELPRNHKYSFPVILGMNPGEPLSTRAPRMKAYDELVQDLDSGGARYSQDLSEVDLSDLDDLKVRVNDPAGDVLLELGASDYLKHYKIYISHAQEWRQQFQKLESVNLRYENQVIVNPDMEGKPHQAALTGSAARAAAAAGVRQAALVTRVSPHQRALPKPVFEMSPQKLDPKTAVTKKAAPRAKSKRSARTTKNTAARPGGNKLAGNKAAAGKKSAPTARAPVPARQIAARSPGPRAAGQPNPAAAKKAAIAKPSPAIARQPTNSSAN